MAKPSRAHFFCSACGNEEPRWFGRCASCGAWNSATEAPPPARRGTRSAGSSAGWTRSTERRPQPLAEVESSLAQRAATGLPELDRVLGGGLVSGSLLLVGGDPGIGKSTLVTQALGGLARGGRPVLYASGEESVAQVAMRARRLGVDDARLALVAETDVDRILAHAHAARP